MEKIKNPWVGLDGYKCFGCAPDNEHGLRLEFFEDGDDVVATWKPEPCYQGWLDTLHGGIQSTLMDELAGWVVFRKLQTAGVRGRIKERKRAAVFIETEIYDSKGELCTRADIVYFAMPQERAEKDFFFKGCDLEE